MEILESQVAKIQLGNTKQTSAFVLTFAEKAPQNDSELFAVVELPLFNPAAAADCERIAQALWATLKRAYKRTVNDTTFELALGEINEELGKLATLGQTNWIGKLNAIVAVKTGVVFNIATTGKVMALLFRDSEFTDITDSPKLRHPLKTFENFATGKLKPGDLLLLSTAELFNHVSVDRLKTILLENALTLAAQRIVSMLEDNAGPEVAFGTMLIYEGLPGATEPAEQPMNLESFLPKQRSVGALLKVAHGAAKKVFNQHNLKKGLDHGKKLLAKRPKVSIANMAEMGKKNLQSLTANSTTVSQAKLEQLRSLSKPKKFFAASAVILVIAVIINITLAKNIKQNEVEDTGFSQSITQIQKLLADADSALLYEDDQLASSSLQNALSLLASLRDLSGQQEATLAPLRAQASELQMKIEKVTVASVENLGSLSAANHLIALPERLATETGGAIVSYNKTTGGIEDGVLKAPTRITLSAFTKDNTAVTYDDQGLSVWNTNTGTMGNAFYQFVPKPTELAGMQYYPGNERVYLIDKAKGQIINFVVSATSLSRPVVWITTPELRSALDIAIDGSIYVLYPGEVSKYNQGRPAEFNTPALTPPLSDSGKIFTERDAQNIYILDSGNKRVVILDKQGKLQNILTSPEITAPQDFAVEEASRTIYILNNGSLLKLTY